MNGSEIQTGPWDARAWDGLEGSHGMRPSPRFHPSKAGMYLPDRLCSCGGYKPGEHTYDIRLIDIKRRLHGM